MLLQTRPDRRLISELDDGRGLNGDFRIVVCGPHRSGTTLLGSLLIADDGCRQIYEPFNPKIGISEASQYFVAGDWPASRWREVLDRLLAGEVFFREPASGPRWMLRWIVGTPAARSLVAARVFRSQRLVLKCPFLTLSSQYLIGRHDMRIAFAVKHPAAFFASLRRVRWHDAVPLDDLVDQGVIGPAARDAATTPAAQAGLLWSVLNRHALETVRHFPRNAAVWSHEGFCRDPHGEMARFTSGLGVGYSEPMRREVTRATEGTVVAPEARTIHQLTRDSRRMIGSWRDCVTPEEERVLRSNCEELYGELTGEAW